MPQIIIRYNRNTIAQYNLNIKDINRVVNTAFAGQSTGLLFEGEKRFDVVVRLKGDLKRDVKDVQNLLIPTPEGTQIPLYQLADVQIQDGPNQIQREDAKRRIVVGFNVRGRDVQSIVNELQKKVENQVKFPAGYYVTYGGAFENLNEAKQRLMIAVPVSLFLIFILLYFAFTSIKQGLLIYSAIPLSAIGGILFLALRGMPFSISAGVGFIALFGVAVLNGIVLIAEFNRLKNEGMKDVKRIVLMGTKVRLRPVLMTACVASLGFLPMALSNGAGAEVQRPLATVVIGGLLIATFLTLFVLPVLYMVFESRTFVKIKSTKNNSGIIASILLLLLIGVSSVGIAQKSITLKSATDSAIHNNLLVKNEQLKAKYQQLLIPTRAAVPKMGITAEAGQINSIYNDSKLGLSQSFSFPKVYLNQKELMQQEWKSSLLNVSVKESLLKKQVAQLFYTILYVNQKKSLLLQADSLYADLYKRAELRLSKGESNILEKVSIETQLGEVRVQLNQIVQDLEILKIEFQLLLNTASSYVPKDSDYKLNGSLISDSSLLKNHASLRLIEQQQQIANASIEVEKSRLLPDFSLGYNNTSIRGTGADNKIYLGSQRFSAVQLGLAIPVFARTQKDKIAAAKFNREVAAQEYQSGMQKLQSDYQVAMIQYKKHLETVNYFESKALKNAVLITTTANQQLLRGNINYLEWGQVIHQATLIKNEYLEALKNLNESIIQLNYLTNQ